MTAIDSFETKRGVARFTDDSIRFEESFRGYLRSLSQGYWHSDHWWRKAIVAGYVFALLFLPVWIINAIRDGQYLLLTGMIGLFVVLRLITTLRGFRSPDCIPLAAIEAISATRGKKGVTRPRLILTYTDDGATHKRRVNMPSLYMDDGENAFERSLAAFEARGFEVN
jgi:hypothetical protein